MAAYTLAFRVTGDEESALMCLKAVADRPREAPQRFLNAVRREARRRRSADPLPWTTPRPHELDHISPADWAMLERVAFRGMSLAEAATAIGIDRREALRRLRDGLIAHRDHRLERQQRRDTETSARKVLGTDLTVRGFDDPPRDRQPEPAPAGGVGI
jgi:hypothetical protein